METKLIEPEVWVEYQRATLDKDNFSRISFADAIHRCNLMPDGCIIRTRSGKKGEKVWEYLL